MAIIYISDCGKQPRSDADACYSFCFPGGAKPVKRWSDRRLHIGDKVVNAGDTYVIVLLKINNVVELEKA